MVGNFLHPNRKNRSISANNANGSINSNPSSSTSASTSTSTSSTSMTQSHRQQQHQFQQQYPPSSISGISTTTTASGGGISTNNMNLHPTYGGSPQHQQSGTILPPSRYAGVTPPVGAAGTSSSYYDIPPTMQFQPPQNLTAEAVAALPPPGMDDTVLI
jgi:hypothetical protein